MIDALTAKHVADRACFAALGAVLSARSDWRKRTEAFVDNGAVR